jgi:hypothetical protein
MIRLGLIHSPKLVGKCDVKDLKFEEVCPVWSEKLRKGLDELDRFILATDSKNCIVGEAWGFTGKQTGYFLAPLIPFVGCWSCVKFGRKIGMVARKNKESRTAADFEPLISEFMSHWNREHKSFTNGIKYHSSRLTLEAI